MAATARPEPCPCGRERTFDRCCGPLLAGARAATAEDLMRSRYTAFARHDESHLLRSWSADTRPDGVRFDPGLTWTGLEVLEAVDGRAFDRTGEVEFVAHLRRAGEDDLLHERSAFQREDGAWVYVGPIAADLPLPGL